MFPRIPRQFGILLLALGFLLLATGMVRWITSRDMQQSEPANSPWEENLAIILLTAGGLAGGGGLAVFARRSRPALLILLGTFFFCVALGFWIFAVEAQRREQLRLDRQWNEIVQQSRQRDPRALPPGRPAPASIAGSSHRVGLCAIGATLIASGLCVWWRKRQTRTSSLPIAPPKS